jgi:hypothetical protein
MGLYSCTVLTLEERKKKTWFLVQDLRPTYKAQNVFFFLELRLVVLCLSKSLVDLGSNLSCYIVGLCPICMLVILQEMILVMQKANYNDGIMEP